MCGLPLTLTHSSPLTLAHFPTHSHTIAHCVCVGVCVCCVQYIVFDICPLTFDSVLCHCPLAFDSVFDTITHVVCVVCYSSLYVFVLLSACSWCASHLTLILSLSLSLSCLWHVTPIHPHTASRVCSMCVSLSGCVCHCLCTRWSPPHLTFTLYTPPALSCNASKILS